LNDFGGTAAFVKKITTLIGFKTYYLGAGFFWQWAIHFK
jgi:hypothetical protein